MRTAHCLIACCLAAGGAAADAAVVPWLYVGEVPVHSQSAVERQRAASTALGELLTRVTGLASLPSSPLLADALAAPGRFYDRYEYARQDVPDSDPSSLPLAVAFHFDPAAVLRLLRDADLPVWAADRPNILAWVVVEQDGGRSIVSVAGADDGSDAIATGLRQRARQRGLELSLPLMDLADSTLGPAAVWGLFWEDVEAASARYGADLLLLGRVRRTGAGFWRSEWDLRSRGAAAPIRLYDRPVAVHSRRRIRPGEALMEAFRHDAASPAAIAYVAVDTMATKLADRFAVRGQLASIPAVVRNAQTVERYAALLAYLQSREYIERVVVHTVRADAIGLDLHSRSSPAQLRELLGIGNVLAAAPEDSPSADALALVWRGAP